MNADVELGIDPPVAPLAPVPDALSTLLLLPVSPPPPHPASALSDIATNNLERRTAK